MVEPATIEEGKIQDIGIDKGAENLNQSKLFNDDLDLAGNGDGDTAGHHEQDRADKHGGQVVTELAAEAAGLLNAPDVIKRLLDIAQQLNNGPEQQGNAYSGD